MIHPRTFSPILLALVVLLSAWSLSRADNEEKLFVATPLTAANAFTTGIEGPACDANGNVYAVNFARQQTIGRIAPNGVSANTSRTVLCQYIPNSRGLQFPENRSIARCFHE